MERELPGIIYKSRDEYTNFNTPIIDSNESMYQIPFEKDSAYFSNPESLTAFAKACENLIRTNKRYKKYINYLKTEVKLDHCQVLTDLNDEDCDIEMHHGPIFTLYDICIIMIRYFLHRGWAITTYDIAKKVLDEHFNNNIQVVMLSSTIHEDVHNRNIFINYRQAFGDLNKFITKYGCVFGDDYREKFNRYVDRSLMEESSDYGILDFSERLNKVIDKISMKQNTSELTLNNPKSF